MVTDSETAGLYDLPDDPAFERLPAGSGDQGER
jgi:hypothetical protein